MRIKLDPTIKLANLMLYTANNSTFYDSQRKAIPKDQRYYLPRDAIWLLVIDAAIRSPDIPIMTCHLGLVNRKRSYVTITIFDNSRKKMATKAEKRERGYYGGKRFLFES